MPFFSKKDSKNNISLGVFAQILIFLGLVGLTALALQPLQRALQGGMVRIRDDFILKAEVLIGREIRYSSIRPSIFGVFDIRNVRILGKDAEGKPTADAPVLAVSRLRLSYSLLSLLRGKSQSIHSVHIDRPLINLDLERDTDLFALFSAPQTGGQSIAALLPENVRFRIRGGQFNLQNRKDQYYIQGLNLDARVGDRRISFEGKWNAGFALAFLLNESLSSRIGMRVSGSCGTDLEEGNAVVSIASLAGGPAQEGELFRMRPVSVGFTLQDKTIALKKLGDRLPLNFNFEYGIETGNISAGFDCAAFKLADLITLSGSWKSANQWFAQAASGYASFERGTEGKLRYRIDLSGGQPAVDSFAIRAGGDEKLALVEDFHFSAPGNARAPGARLFQGEFGFRGSLALAPLGPNGLLFFRDLSFSGNEGLSAEFSVSSQGNEISIFAETVRMGTVDMSAFDISLFLSDSDLGFMVSALRFRDLDYNDVRLSSLSLEGSMSYAPALTGPALTGPALTGRRQLEASFRLDSFSAADLGGMVSPFVKEPAIPGITGSMLQNTAITTEVFFTTDFGHLLYNAPRFVIAYEEPGGGSGNMVGMVSVSGTDQHFEVSEGRLIWANNVLSVSAYADYANPMDINFSLMANYRDLSWYLEGMMLDRRTVTVQGSYGLRAYITASDTGAYSGYAEARDLPVPIRGQSAHFSFYTSLRYDSRDFWSLDVDYLEALDIASPAGNGQLRIMGKADQDGASFPLLHYSDRIGPLNGRADFSWARNFSDFSGTINIGENIEENQGEERYHFDGSYAEKHLELAVSGFGMRLDRVLYNANNALATGDLRISWDSVQSFQAELTLNSLSARVQETNLLVYAKAALNGDAFSVTDLHLNFAGIESVMPLLRVSRTESRAVTRADFQGYARGRWVEGAFALDARFKPIESWIEINQALNSISGAIRVEKLRYADLKTDEPFDVEFARNNGALSVAGGPKNMLRLQLDRDGNFYAGLSAPFPVRGSVVGSINNNYIDAHCADLYVDLAGLWDLIPPMSEFALAGGYVNAQVDIRGPLGDPEFFGSARGTSVRIQVPHYVAADIRPIPFTVAITGNEMSFGPVPTTVGGGAGTAAGWFRFDRWIPNIFTMDIIVPVETPIPFSFDITGFLAHGGASGKLTLSMEDMVFGITGDLFANNTEMGLNTDEISRAQGMDMFSQSIKPITVDLKITTGPIVEFFWPNSKFPILRANPDMGTVVTVTVDSLARQFTLNSDIKIRSGEIFYFERSFYIRRGNLVLRENEQQFNPRLTARAEVRDRNDEGPVTISMVVENAPLLSFVPRFESTPSLSQVEIFSLLGHNITGSQGEESALTAQRAVVASTTDLLAQFVVVRQLERQIRNYLRLDMFSVRTQVLQNAVLNAAGLGSNPVDRNSRVGNYFDNTTVFLGKYIGADMFIQSMLSMRYDENKTTMGGLSFEPDIGVELQTPLFNIRWDFIPAHPENWYVNDISISLTKTLSF
ncbi:hypothetical protein AGMMS50293_26460 [Spirochaetia bacterium]|nr:hypothetical protein AGMMS50293_26460 [Spirochaetia bacterium]